MKRFPTFIVGLGLTLSLAGQAQAVSVNFGPSSSNVDGIDLVFNLGVPTTIVGDATLALTLDGDFNQSNENALITVDGFSLGTVLNDNTGDDDFDFANGDDPDGSSQAGNPDTGTATILNADIAPLIADGAVQIIVNTSPFVGFSLTTVSGTLSYETGVVPEPSTVILFGTGLAGLVAWRMRKGRA